MPVDVDGRWKPEPHKAEQYTEAQSARAQAALSSFNRAASGEVRTQPSDPQIPRVAAATTLQMTLTPFGHSRLAPNAQDHARTRRVAKAAQHIGQRSFTQAHRDWLRRDLSKEFAKSNQNVKNKELDLER